MAGSLILGLIAASLLASPLPLLGGLMMALVLGFLVSPGVLSVDKVKLRLAYVDGVSADVQEGLPSAADCDAELLHSGL